MPAGNMLSPIAQVQPDIDRWSLVITGAWNPPIFTVEWAGSHIFPGADKVESATGILDNGLVAERLSAIDLRLTVFPNKIEFNPLAPSRGALERIEETAVRILERLRDTPVTAFGINLGFNTEADSVVRALVASDGGQLEGAGYKSHSVALQRRILHGDHVINFTLVREGSLAVKLNLNHHCDARGSQTMLNSIRGSVKRALDHTQRLLAVYGLEFDAK